MCCLGLIQSGLAAPRFRARGTEQGAPVLRRRQLGNKDFSAVYLLGE